MRRFEEADPWTLAEIELLRENYLPLDKAAILALMPGRTWGSCIHKAMRMGLPSKRGERVSKARAVDYNPHSPWPQRDDDLRAMIALREDGERLAWVVIADRLGISRNSVKQRAAKLGLLSGEEPARNYLPWTLEEKVRLADLKAVRDATGKGMSNIAIGRTLERSPLAIAQMSYDMGLNATSEKPERVARLAPEDAATAANTHRTPARYGLPTAPPPQPVPVAVPWKPDLFRPVEECQAIVGEVGNGRLPTFCGQPAEPHRSYCAACAKLFLIPAPKRINVGPFRVTSRAKGLARAFVMSEETEMITGGLP